MAGRRAARTVARSRAAGTGTIAPAGGDPMRIELSERRRRHIVGVLLLATALLTLASLASWRPPGPDETYAPTNWGGPLGALLAGFLIGTFGAVLAFGIPLLAFA